jgi:hypothetical protein
MVRKKGLLSMFVAVALACFVSLSLASAATLFSDNFNSGGLAGWTAVCFQDCNGQPSSDVGTKSDSDNYDGTLHAFAKDDTGFYTSVSTSNYNNIVLSYCRRLDSSTGDSLRVGWKTGSASANWNDWNQLEVYTVASWACVNQNLPSGASNTSILIAFFLDNGNNANGLVENVAVTGDLIVAPVCSNGQTQACSTGLQGVCSAGTQTCVSGSWGSCVQNTQSSAEVCNNGLDDDCDGLIDLSDTSDCATPQCQTNADCNSYDFIGSDYCSEGNVFANFTDYNCVSGSCSAGNPVVQLQESCTFGCSAGVCLGAPSTETVCNDKVDNDDDGYTDCADSDCADNVACQIQEDLPVCSIDYLESLDGGNNFNISVNKYINQVGLYSIHGYAIANDGCYLMNWWYTRTSPNLKIPSGTGWEEAGDSTLYDFFWKTSAISDDRSYSEGNHSVCCKVWSQTCESGCTNFYNTNCKTFCIDTQAPSIVSSIWANGEDCSDEEDVLYSSIESISWSWEAPSVTGCAPIDYYEVQLFYSNGTWISTFEQKGTTFNYTGVNNNDYYIKVKAVDMAENSGEWSSASDEIVVDTEDPVVAINSPADGFWTKDSFNVVESDSDNIGFEYCQIRINNGSWQNTVCGEENTFAVNVDTICSSGSVCLNIPVEKQVRDKACRVASDSINVNIDRQAPNTTKTVGEPRYPGVLGYVQSWLGWVIDWFVTDETQLTFSADDGVGIGNITTFYVVKNSSGNIVASGEGNVVMNLFDGVYNVTYYSVDGLGNTELVKSEIDKVDTEAPVTSKTYSLFVYGWRKMPLFNDMLVWMRFIRPDTNITLVANDAEVGVDKTYYQILVPAEGEGSEVEYYCHNGNNNGTWYETSQERMTCTATNWVNTYRECESDIKGWCEYAGPINVEESEHKICYYSVDKLGNTEDVKCQVFSVDGIGPTTYILNPSEEYGSSIKSCVLPVDVKISDEKVGVSNNAGEVYVELAYSNETLVGKYNLTKYISLQDGSEWWYYPNSLDLTGLPTGNYILSVYAKDKLGNSNIVETRNIYLEPGIFIQKNQIKGCNVGLAGGNCNMQFNACVRGATQMDFAMTKLLDSEENPVELASPADLNATIITPVDSGYVGLLDWQTSNILINGEIVNLKNLNCGEVINGRVNFNLSLGFNQALVQNIGSGKYYFDWKLNSYSDPIECDLLD